jgi:hypothetical protein
LRVKLQLYWHSQGTYKYIYCCVTFLKKNQNVSCKQFTFVFKKNNNVIVVLGRSKSFVYSSERNFSIYVTLITFSRLALMAPAFFSVRNGVEGTICCFYSSQFLEKKKIKICHRFREKIALQQITQ